jgi:excinuclease UvrABC ATPase subunit
VFSGTLDGLMHEPRSLTSILPAQELAIPIPTTRRRGNGQKIRLLARRSNLKAWTSASR